MCLGGPGKIVQIDDHDAVLPMGPVNFGGILKDVCLAYVPEAQVGDYVVVHVGFAISRVDEAEAMEVFKFLTQMEELAELEIPQPADGPPHAPQPEMTPA
jgi:hydrogenase expression/formation protein HypC